MSLEAIGNTMKQTKQQPVPLKEEEVIDVKLAAAQQEAEESKTKYLRALADYQNLVKRTEAEKQETRMFATEQFLKKLLPVIDTLELAQHHVQNDGLALALKELYAVLGEYGVEKINEAGMVFDPHTMECVEVVEGEKDHVVQILTSGYRMHDKLLRPSKVQVGGGIKGGTYV
jgi:molecular chaperone GrpE